MSTDLAATSPEHVAFRDTVRRFLEKEVAPHLDAWEEHGCFDRMLFLKAGEAGLLVPGAPAELGGSDADASFAAIVVEEAAGYSHFGLALSAHSELVGSAIVRCLPNDCLEPWLSRLASGELIGASALTERDAVCSHARADSGGYLLSGVVRDVVNGAVGDLIVVRANVEGEGVRSIVVEASAAGVVREVGASRPWLKGLGWADVRFEQVRVSKAQMLADEPARSSDWQHLMVALSAASAAAHALEITKSYVKERRAFGQTLWDFQNTRFTLAELRADAEVVRHFVDCTVLQYVQGGGDPEDAVLAAHRSLDVLRKAVDAGVQLHGGYGFMWEYPIARAYADASGLALLGRPRSLRTVARGHVPVPDDFRTRAREFLGSRVVPKLAGWAAQSGFDRELFTDAGHAGLLCVTVPTAYGGGGLTRAASIALLEEGAGLANVGLSLCMHSEIVANYLLSFGSEELKQRWLPAMARGEAIGALGMSEPSAGSDVKALRTTAQRAGEHYILSGSKIFISCGGVADFVIVAAKTDPAVGAKGISLFVVDTTLPGFRRGRRLRKLGLRSQDTAEIFFDRVPVPVDALLGEEGRGFGYMMKELPWERLQIAITSIAAAESALQMTVSDLESRGEALEAVRMAAADVRLGRAYIDHCVQRLLRGDLDELTATIAKLWLSEMHGRVVDACLSLAGPAANTLGHPAVEAFLDARAQRIYGGASEIMKEIIARSLGD